MNLGYDYDKSRTSLRYWMLGRGFTTAVRAMDFGMRYHTGLRKDGTPEFSHQVFQANYARTMADQMIDPEGTLCTIFLHDCPEDIPEVTVPMIITDFGPVNGHSVELMTNCFPNGEKKPKAHYYGAMEDDPRSSIAKGVDRMHNHQSMGPVFSPEKKLSYMDETTEYIIPMLKRARKNFPEQEPVYQNIKHVLLTQIELIRNSLE